MATNYRNIMEEVVLANLKSVVKEVGCCDCDVCKTDVITMTLNKLPPRYVSTNKGEIFSMLDAIAFQSAADIIFTMSQSAKLVKERPSKDCERKKQEEAK